MNEMKTSDRLDLAADKIEEQGWGQGWGRRSGLCLIDALSATGAGWCAGLRPIEEYLSWDIHGRGPVYNWNDAPERKEHEVIEVLRAAAMVERTKEAAAGYDDEDQPLPFEVRVA